MKFRQNFRYKENTVVDDEIKYKYLKYQQIEWTFGKYNCTIIESSIHWNLLFFELIRSDENIKYEIKKEKKYIEISIEIINVYDKNIEHIILAFFNYACKKIDIEENLIMNDNKFLVTYFWNDMYIDLIDNKISKVPIYMNIQNMNSSVLEKDSTDILREYYNIIKKKYMESYKENIVI